MSHASDLTDDQSLLEPVFKAPGKRGRTHAQMAILAAILGFMFRKGRGLLGGVLALFAIGCSGIDSSAEHYAKSACTAYQESGRVQVSATADQASAIHDLARSNARAAAAFDSRWTSLSSDIQAALDLQEGKQNPPPDNEDLFFEIDKRVQNDCSDAGRDIGDLEP